MDLLKQPRNSFLKFFLKLPSTLHCIRVASWLGLTITSRTDLPIMRIIHQAKQLQYVETRDYHFFSRNYLQTLLNSEVDIFCYIAVI
jgi:hypothetical protein